MKVKFLMIASVVLLAMSFALTAGAGSIDDGDSDLIPDVFDNCSIRANGPNDDMNQTDTDSDGFGNTCDCDFTQDGFVLVEDIVSLFGAFNTVDALHDNTGDGVVLVDDVVTCLGLFNLAVGPGATG